MSNQLSPLSKELFEDHTDLITRLAQLNMDGRQHYMAAAEAKDSLGIIEAEVVLALGGWGNLGKNDTERKYALELALSKSGKYQEAKRVYRAADAELADIKEQREMIMRQLSGNGNKMRLLAAEILAMSTVRVDVPEAVEALEDLEF